MKITTENNIRWLTVENEDNSLFDIEQNAVLGSRLILAKSIDESNVNRYFREITAEEVEELERYTEELKD